MKLLILLINVGFIQSTLKINTFFRKFCTTALLSSSVFTIQPIISRAADASSSLTDQLKNLQSAQILTTKTRIENDEAEAITRALQYPSGYLISRGIVTLTQDEKGDKNPYGVPQSYLVDELLGKEEASLFVLAVGREGPPLAAKKITNVNNLQFPLLVELTSDDLLFPYTSQAWQASTNRDGSIAMTAILSTDDKLSTANAGDRLGWYTAHYYCFTYILVHTYYLSLYTCCYTYSRISPIRACQRGWRHHSVDSRLDRE